MQFQYTGWNVVPQGVVTVPDEPADDFETPSDPFSSRSITLAGAFPTTVTASTVAGINVTDPVADWSDLISIVTAAGGSISVNVPIGTEVVGGGVGTPVGGMSIVSPKGNYAPFESGKGPTSYLVIPSSSGSALSTGASQTDGSAHFFVQGFVCGGAPSLFNQDQAYPFTSGGTYQIQVGDEITGATSGVTATVLQVHLDSGSWGAGTAAGRLVVKARTGIWTNNGENLNVGLNLNVATLTDNTIEYGPRTQFGVNAIKHQGLGKVTLVSCYLRNTSSDTISTIPEVSIETPTPRMYVYDSLVERGGTDNQKHNIYAHRQAPVQFIRSGSINPGGGGHALKLESFGSIVLDSYTARDYGELDTIADDTITVVTGTQALNLDGVLCGGGVATLPITTDTGYPLIKAFSTGNCTGRWINLTGTDASDTVITDQIRMGNGSPVFSALRFKTLTGATITNVSGTPVITGQRVFVSAGRGDPSEGQAVIDFSRAQDFRMARTVVNARSYGSGTGGRAIFAAARTSVFGGCGPKTPPLVDNTTVGAGGLTTPLESNGYSGSPSTTNFIGQCDAAIGATATTIDVQRLSRWPGQTDISPALSTSSAYRLRVARIDGTIATFASVTPSSASGTNATIPLGAQVGGGGVALNAFVGIQLTTAVDDNMDFNSRWYNQADPLYYWDQIRDGVGALDRTKQAFFNTHYLEDVFVINEHTQNRHLFAAGQEFQHWTWCNGASGFLVEAPLPPGNRPQGQWKAAFSNGGTYVPQVGDSVFGQISGGLGTVGGVKLTSGAWASNTGAGTIWLSAKSGTFQAEELTINGNANCVTITDDIPQDWPNVTGAATLTGVLAGWGFGIQPNDVVDGDTLGNTTDVVWPWLSHFKNIGWTTSSKSSGTLTQFNQFTAPDDGPASLRMEADMRWVNGGVLTRVAAANVSPMPVPAMTTVTTAASADVDKLYLASTTGFTAGKRVHADYPLRPGADRSVYIGTVQSTGSDGGGSFVIVSPAIGRAIDALAPICAFTDAGSDPANWVTPSDYLSGVG